LREQRADLLGGGGVVQHDKGPDTGKQATVGGGAGSCAVGDLLRG
jgi:hypothetical protein